MPSVGSVKIPIISTFDPAGIVAAKAGMRDLSQTKVGSQGGGGSSAGGGGAGGGGGGGGQSSYAKEADQIFERTRTSNEKYEYQVRKLDDLHKRGALSTDTYHRAIKQAGDQLPKTPGMMSKLGVGQAGQTLADQVGLGGITGAMGAGGIVAGAALAGVAIYGLTQKVAGEAVALKEHARQLGVSTNYYSGMTAAAHKAGVSVETVTQGLSGMRSMAGGALTGDIGAALFLRSMGIGRSDLESGYEDTEGLSRKMLSAAQTPGQKAAIFGSVAAANAIGGANSQEHPWYAPTAGNAQAASGLMADTSGLLVKGVGEAVMNLKWMFGGGNFAQQEAAANANEAAERAGQLQAEKTKIGISTLPGLLSPREMAQENEAASKGIFDEFGDQKDRYTALNSARIRQQQTQAESPYMKPRELQERELSDWKDKADAKGYSNERQATEAAIQIRERGDVGLSGVRSNSENIQATMKRGNERWNNAPGSGAFGGKFEASEEQQDVARGLGDKLTDYAESITRSGSLAGAYDVNSVAGYSQQVGSEYQMDQSKDTLNLIAQLLQKLVDKTPEGESLITTIMGNLGFRTADPILGGR